MGDPLLEIISIVVLIFALIPLASFIFVYNTRPVPGSRWRRKFVPKWTTSLVGWALMSLVTSLFLILAYLLVVRFIGDFPGRIIVSLILFVYVMGSLWGMLGALIVTQRTDEKADQAGG